MSRNMKSHAAVVIAVCALSTAVGAVFASDASPIKSFDCSSMSDVITKSGVTVDQHGGADSKGALKLVCDKDTVFRLFEVATPDVENARLVYKAKIKTKDVSGKAYLEMWCHVPDKGEFFSRGLDQPLSGTNGWTTAEIPFLLKAGQKADRVKLNFVINGSGTAWIDDVELAKSSL